MSDLCKNGSQSISQSLNSIFVTLHRATAQVIPPTLPGHPGSITGLGSEILRLVYDLAPGWLIKHVYLTFHPSVSKKGGMSSRTTVAVVAANLHLLREGNGFLAFLGFSLVATLSAIEAERADPDCVKAGSACNHDEVGLSGWMGDRYDFPSFLHIVDYLRGVYREFSFKLLRFGLQ